MAELQLSYKPRVSFLHSIDPVSKLIWLMSMTVLSFVDMGPALMFAVFVGASLTAVRLGGMRWREYVRLLTYLIPFGTSIFIFQALFVARGQDVLLQVGFVSVSRIGVTAGFSIALRLIIIAVASVTFSITTSPRDFVVSLITFLRIPYRFAYTLYTTLRFLPIFEEEARSVQAAYAIRAAGASSNRLLERLEVIGKLTIPLLTTGIRKAQLTAIAMDSRAFGAYTKRTTFYEVSISRRGFAFAVIHILVTLLGVVWVLTGHGRWLTT